MAVYAAKVRQVLRESEGRRVSTYVACCESGFLAEELIESVAFRGVATKAADIRISVFSSIFPDAVSPKQ